MPANTLREQKHSDVEPCQQERFGTPLHIIKRRPRVVIVGAGFGGINAARALGNRDVDVLVLNRTNYHGFWMMLYQVASAQIEPEVIAQPVRAMLRRYHNVQFRVADVQGVDLERRIVETDSEDIPYDYLVLAAGSTTQYFGNEERRQQTLGMHDLSEAEQLRDRVLTAFEQASHEPDLTRRKALMTIVVVGGGPTGVEWAGAFTELVHGSLAKDYPLLDMSSARVVLVESSSTILSVFPTTLQRNAQRKLERLGVELRVGTAVTNVDHGMVMLADGSAYEAHTVVWAAGVRAGPLADALGVALGRGARVPVQPTLNLADHPEVFVVGDMAYLENADGAAYPMVAQVAMQMGKQAGANILALNRGSKPRPFKYFDFGQMAMVGRGGALFDSFGVHLAGILGWCVWLAVHLFYLPGLRNRLVALLDWLGTMITGEAGVRTTMTSIVEEDAIPRDHLISRSLSLRA
ncbi:MAG TPA: NAD(P)/FAD-dependent oxidoreductase [Roseiflexaceae bacterium]|nr:NAD(P)/FAD-dependent oxidoreductase [Roseiflexaceae bacterium]